MRSLRSVVDVGPINFLKHAVIITYFVVTFSGGIGVPVFVREISLGFGGLPMLYEINHAIFKVRKKSKLGFPFEI